MIHFMQGVSDKLVKMGRQRVDNRIEVIAKAHRRSVHSAKNEKNCVFLQYKNMAPYAQIDCSLKQKSINFFSNLHYDWSMKSTSK